jgi:hypothetical protein
MGYVTAKYGNSLVRIGGSPVRTMPLIDAYGGNSVYRDGDYIVHIFTADGSLYFVSPGDVSLFIVGGGGGGMGSAASSYYDAGGGGASGDYLLKSIKIPIGSYHISIGAGAVGRSPQTSDIAYGGTSFLSGPGIYEDASGGASAISGLFGNYTSSGANSWSYSGGGGIDGAAGGGGAGMAGNGASASSDGPLTAGGGGIGILTSITGSPIGYCGGGQGGGQTGLWGVQSSYGGGSGSLVGGTEIPAQSHGRANSGGGGGGIRKTGSPFINGGSGGSGIVIIRYKFI